MVANSDDRLDAQEPQAMRTIHCPQCSVRLDVPDAAGGKAARCPACKTTFQIPDAGEMLDETVVCWLDLDRFHADEEKEEVMDASSVQSALSTDPAPEQESPTDDTLDLADAKPEPSEPEPAPATQSDPPEDQLSLEEAMGEEPSQPNTHGSFVAMDAVDDAVDTAAKQTKTETPVTHQQYTGKERRRPLLQVVDVGAFGVRFRFHVRLFDLPGFRASMPMKCIAGGEPTNLIARPLPWVDKATGQYVNPGEIEARYELNVRSHQSPREVLATMSPIEQLPTPFNQPIPYYVSREKAKDVSLHCQTFHTPEGVQCEVVIPSGGYALDWLGRVNGVCGEDYATLEAEVLKFDAKAWRSIPQEVRHRLGAWFDFDAGENFLGYFNDSDFARSEAGLAGIVLTDHRLVHCKYHHHGSLQLTDEAHIAAIVDGQFADLKAKLANSTKRLVRLRRTDAVTLSNMLQKLNAKLSMGFYKPKPKPEEKPDKDESLE